MSLALITLTGAELGIWVTIVLAIIGGAFMAGKLWSKAAAAHIRLDRHEELHSDFEGRIERVIERAFLNCPLYGRSDHKG